MLVEHVFVTTLEADSAVRQAGEFLMRLGFRVRSATPKGLEAVRGRPYPNTTRVRQLPQLVKLEYDRGRVSVAAGIAARGGKDVPVHMNLMLALVRGLERLLVERLPPEQAAAEWAAVEASSGRVRTVGDKMVLGCLVVLAALVVGLILIGLILALASRS